MDNKGTIWSGHFFWFQGPQNVLPLTEEPMENLYKFNVKGAIKFATPVKETWCRYLKIGFWHKVCCDRIAQDFKKYMKAESKDCFNIAVVKVKESKDADVFLKAFESGFCGLVKDYYSNSFVMLMMYNTQQKQYRALIPLDKKLFNTLAFYSIHMYLCVNYDILHEKELTHKLLAEAEKAASLYRQGKTDTDIIEDLRGVLSSSNIVKRNILASFVARSRNFEEKVLHGVDDPEDIW